MTAELICVGTELLLGNIVNTNGAYLARKCAALGLSMYHQSIVGDNDKRLEETIRTATDRSDVVILCGGLGPTKDDLTKEVAAKVMEKKLKEDKHSRERIQAYMDNYVKSHPGTSAGICSGDCTGASHAAFQNASTSYRVASHRLSGQLL